MPLAFADYTGSQYSCITSITEANCCLQSQSSINFVCKHALSICTQDGVQDTIEEDTNPFHDLGHMAQAKFVLHFAYQH